MSKLSIRSTSWPNCQVAHKIVKWRIDFDIPLLVLLCLLPIAPCLQHRHPPSSIKAHKYHPQKKLHRRQFMVGDLNTMMALKTFPVLAFDATCCKGLAEFFVAKISVLWNISQGSCSGSEERNPQCVPTWFMTQLDSNKRQRGDFVNMILNITKTQSLHGLVFFNDCDDNLF